jgi:endoglucanase
VVPRTTTTNPEPTTTTTVPPQGPEEIIAGLDTLPGSDATAISEIGRTPALINGFFGFVNNGSAGAFPKGFADSILSLGSTPMITWEPEVPSETTTSVLTSISDGSLDTYITGWAQAAKAEKQRIYLRLMHEFNGTWYPWGAVVAGRTLLPGGKGTYPYTNTPDMYVAAYQHIVTLFRNAGATNVEFVWCAATGAPISTLPSYYPGDGYVDWVSLDGYNRSAQKPVSFYGIFSAGYASLVALTSHPILVAETASVEYSGLATIPSSKAQWITQAYLDTIPTYFPQIKAIDYFDSAGNGYTYPIDSSTAALQAIKQVFSSSLYQGRA